MQAYEIFYYDSVPKIKLKYRSTTCSFAKYDKLGLTQFSRQNKCISNGSYQSPTKTFVTNFECYRHRRRGKYRSKNLYNLRTCSRINIVGHERVEHNTHISSIHNNLRNGIKVGRAFLTSMLDMWECWKIIVEETFVRSSQEYLSDIHQRWNGGKVSSPERNRKVLPFKTNLGFNLVNLPITGQPALTCVCSASWWMTFCHVPDSTKSGCN